MTDEHFWLWGMFYTCFWRLLNKKTLLLRAVNGMCLVAHNESQFQLSFRVNNFSLLSLKTLGQGQTHICENVLKSMNSIACLCAVYISAYSQLLSIITISNTLWLMSHSGCEELFYILLLKAIELNHYNMMNIFVSVRNLYTCFY